MLIVVLLAIGLAAGLAAASLFGRARGRLLLAAGGVVLWGVYAIYIEAFAACPDRGECDKGLGVLFLGAVLAGWLLGVAASWLVRRPRNA